MSGEIEFDKCDMCGEEAEVQRKYYYYDINCKCCDNKDGHHFEIVKYCKDCDPEPPHRINPVMAPLKELSDSEELTILRDLLWAIGNASIGAQKDGGKHLGDIISEIRYGYCYSQSNSYIGQTDQSIEDARIKSLLRIKKIIKNGNT